MARPLIWIISPGGGLIWQARTDAGIYQIDHRSVIARFIPRIPAAHSLAFHARFASVEEAQVHCERHWSATATSQSGRRWIGPGW